MAERHVKSLTAYKTDHPKKKILNCINEIMGTLAFRKLSEKTQVILSLSGPDVRTRLTHTIEVAKIARDISENLGLNYTLAEAIALAHDLGHTPFGHVGERTLREIMCGCDTLEGKIADANFDNSGFKHNLQTFRVMNNLEELSNDSKDTTWPYILWGATDHTKMTYSKSYSAMDNEIYISCRHCDWVYSCNFHERKECKRNVQKKKIRTNKGKEICKPWFCAKLLVIYTKKEAKTLKPAPGESWEDLIPGGYIQTRYLKNIFCNQKCYLAKLWKHKIDNKELYSKFRFLFDHPFPNSFYAKGLNEYFFKKNNKDGWISVEAQIVKRSDEIAQRQGDLEDGIAKGLMSLKNAKESLIELVENCKFSFESKKTLKKQIEAAKNPKKIGAFIVEFYSGLLKESTEYNFKKFANKTNKQEEINIYCIMHLIISLSNDENKKKEWMLRELECIAPPKRNNINIRSLFLKNQFVVKTNRSNFFFIVYDYIDSLPKSNAFLADRIDHKIFLKYMDCLGLSSNKEVIKYKKSIKKKDYYSANIALMRAVEIIRGHLKIKYLPIYKDFFLEKIKKHKWKIGHLSLPQFYVLYMIYIEYVISGPKISCIQDLVTFCKKDDFDIPPYSKHNKKDCFKIWKNIRPIESNQIMSKIVNFVKDNDLYENNYTALDTFNENTWGIILKSEIVEKHDGKATFILKRLFKAYIDNAHQLPDEGLKNILFAVKESISEYIKEEKEVTKGILEKLSKTLPFNDRKNNEIINKIANKDFLDLGNGEYENITSTVSNEIEALLEEKKNLYDFLRIYLINNDKLKSSHKDEFVRENNNMKIALREFRLIMDNPILNATPLWKSILTRGICDHIAGLTDHEAIDEYEKLYAGIMEIV